MLNNGRQYIKDSHSILHDTEIVIGELPTQCQVWGTYEEKWVSAMTKFMEIERHGFNKFCAEKSLKGAEESLFFILRKNISWRIALIRSAIMENKEYEVEAKQIQKASLIEFKVINFTYTYSSIFGEQELKGSLDAFDSAIKTIREKIHPKAFDLTQIARIESMIYLCVDQLSNVTEKVKKLRWNKDASMARIVNSKIPHLSLVKELVQACKEWKPTQSITDEERSPAGSEDHATDKEPNLAI